MKDEHPARVALRGTTAKAARRIFFDYFARSVNQLFGTPGFNAYEFYNSKPPVKWANYVVGDPAFKLLIRESNEVLNAWKKEHAQTEAKLKNKPEVFGTKKGYQAAGKNKRRDEKIKIKVEKDETMRKRSVKKAEKDEKTTETQRR